MKRAILVTTGTVVGITSVLAYKPNIDALTLVPGTESLSTVAGVNSQPATTVADTSAEQATASATPTTGAGAAASTGTPSASASASASATSQAAATPKATASASSTPKATATSTPSATASATASSSASASSNSISASNGTHTGSSEIVESHGHTYGSLVATVTVSNGEMTALSFSQTPSGRNEQFISAVNTYLVPEILRTQNVTVGIVTGATGTSMALINSLKSALGMA